MRKTLIAGNWKMNASSASTQTLLQAICAGLEQDVPDVDIAVFPPFPYLAQTAQTLNKTPIGWGAQTVSEYAPGAFTGQVSLEMLQDLACRYVLVGHSERRQYNDETNAVLARQFARVMTSDITPILCVGESLSEREGGQTETVIEQQLAACLGALGASQTSAKCFIIAYEPVWAIGTGKTAELAQIQQTHAFIRHCCARFCPYSAEDCRILYGGSVKPDNAAAIMSLTDVDGVLVGGCSLHSEQFLSIIRASQPITERG